MAGTITVVGAITTPGQNVSSPGTFATVSFTAGTAMGTSALDLSNVRVYDPQGQAVPITVTDGSVTIQAATVGMVIVPTSKTVTVSQDFTVDIKVTNSGGAEVRAAGAHLDFDTTYLEVQSITPGAALDNVLQNDHDNGAGTIDYAAGAWVNPPVTDFVLATVKFRAKAATAGTALTFVFTPAIRETSVLLVGGGNVLDPADVMDGSVTVTEPEYALTMAVNPTEGGTATDETGESPYEEGDGVSIKAEAAAGWEFVGWTAPAGAFSNANAAVTTFTMPAQDVIVTANFGPLALELECLVSPNPTEVGHETDFTAAASGGVPPYSWSWTIGGTEVAMDQNTTYTFDTAGTYDVCVTVTDSLGNEEQCCKTVTVNEAIIRAAAVDFDPDTFNLRSKGKVVTVYIELPPGYDVNQIDITSIRLNDTVPALARPTRISDYDKDSVPDLMVKFDRAAMKNLLTPGSQVEITITGEVAGVGFEGSDTIRVISK